MYLFVCKSMYTVYTASPLSLVLTPPVLSFESLTLLTMKHHMFFLLWLTPSVLYTLSFLSRGLQRDVVYLCWPIAPSYRSPTQCGGHEGLRLAGSQPSQPMSIAVHVHITWLGAQIKFGDLRPYLTYVPFLAWVSLTSFFLSFSYTYIFSCVIFSRLLLYALPQSFFLYSYLCVFKKFNLFPLSFILSPIFF